MKKVCSLLTLVALIGFAIACNKDKATLTSNTTTTDSPVLPADVDVYYYDSVQVNKITTLGRVLFYDKHLSINNSVSCGSCHQQAHAFADNIAFSHGFDNRNTMRNTPSIENLGGPGLTHPTRKTMAPLFWDSREHVINNLIARPITNHVEMGVSDFSDLTAKLSALPYYKKLFNDAFGSDQITVDNISQAISYFICAIKATHTRFDDTLNQKLTALELQGWVLFTTKYNCALCHHVDPNGYANGADILNIGLDISSIDKGYGAISGISSFDGSFKVPNLRNVALTAPYMHDGRFKTLDEVLDFYSHGIQNAPNLNSFLKGKDGQPVKMNISEQERSALKAFLNTLTDYKMITDPKFSDPFKTSN